MIKQPHVRWDEPSAPEISIEALIQDRAEEFKPSVGGERFGKYLLVGEIAVGGMAELFLAVHKGVEGFIKVVVIKRVLPSLTSNPEFLRMFVDEARLEARLEHPNIVRTYEFGEVGGRYFTAMEYLPGEDLCKVLNSFSSAMQLMPLHIATGFAAQLCAGLHFAHHFTDTDGKPLNLVHRDINPANVIITYGGEVKIIDFGVAKSNANVRTINGVIKGKVAYMPPEQVLGHEVDHRADIFSAGVVLWEMLTGRPLFVRSNEAATLYAIMNGPIPLPSKIRSDVPPELDKIVTRALARSPADRYDSADAMATDLEAVLATLPRYDTRVVAAALEELFGAKRAEAKRSIAQTRSLMRNVSLVMKLRSDVRGELADELDDVPGARGSQSPLLAASRPPRTLAIVLGLTVLAAIGAALVITLPRAEREPVVKQVAASRLRVESTPPGAAVFIGGEPTGLQTPTTLTGITKKQLVIRLELSSHNPETRTIELAEGTTGLAQIKLVPLPGRLVLADLPARATITVDGQDYDAGELIPVDPGKHNVRVVLDGKTVAEQAIETASGDQSWKLFHGKFVAN